MIHFGRRVLAGLDALLAEHSQGAQTTIYADQAMLDVINSAMALPSVLRGLQGLRARSIHLLTSMPADEGASIEDGPHILFLLGTVDWTGTEAWEAIERVIQNNSTRQQQQLQYCTLCVSVPESLWGDSLALSPNARLKAPLNQQVVQSELQRMVGRQSDVQCKVAVHTVVAAALPGGHFELPTARGRLLSSPGMAVEWADGERVALGLASLMHSLDVDARYYSPRNACLARRVARRCASMAAPTGVQHRSSATVVILDRASDWAAAVRHGGHFLDDLYRCSAVDRPQLAMLLRRSGVADSLAAQAIRQRADRVAAECEGLREVVVRMEEAASRGRWREMQAVEKTLALVLAAEDDVQDAWDQVLAAIPPLPSDVDDMAGLLSHTLALMAMAAALLGYRRLGIPPIQRALAAQRLASDYNALTSQTGAEEGAAWAARAVERLNSIAEGGSGGGSFRLDSDGVHVPLLPRVAADVLSGCPPYVPLELADRRNGGGAGAASSLLKGIGMRFLSHRSPSPASPTESAGDSFGLGGQSAHHRVEEAAAASDMVVFFIVGGMTFGEAADMVAAVSAKGPPVLVGCTGIASAVGLFAN
ncbi:hypothetical protein BX661DRAFT_176176 [Kickxella alabastrina]|uniref:uncharacterized protein n=1 Tax=Kickxella alabastrina TaxID=61397 RepID=UPI00221F323B|nr:uncharacterized protein BX661DRAFT_176176 [Kickxella alabastrina]KAI7835151.1 hypothetical protein BX661DRAFT_176176 [Kickxella alabastrina]